MTRSKTTWLCATALSALIFTPAALADRYERQVRAQLLQAEEMLEERGFIKTHNASFDRLNEGSTDQLSFSLEKGRDYVIVALCDNDCRDIDLRLYDENDNLVGKDIETDDTPIVRVSPRWSGSFALRVNMHACSAEPCTYGVSIYTEGKRRGNGETYTRL